MYCGVPSDRPVCVMRCAARLLNGERDTEIRDERLAIVQQDVLGLDVAVDHAVAVRVVERARHFARDAHGFANRKLPLARQSCAQRLAGDYRHHVVQQSVSIATVEQRKYVRMLQPCCRANLAQETIGAQCGTEIRMKHLDRDIAIVPQIMREIDGSHPASAELALDAVAVGERRCESLNDGHRAQKCSGVAKPARSELFLRRARATA